MAISIGLPFQGHSGYHFSLPVLLILHPSSSTSELQERKEGSRQIWDIYIIWFLIDLYHKLYLFIHIPHYLQLHIGRYICYWHCRPPSAVFCYLGDIWGRKWRSPGILAEILRRDMSPICVSVYIVVLYLCASEIGYWMLGSVPIYQIFTADSSIRSCQSCVINEFKWVSVIVWLIWADAPSHCHIMEFNGYRVLFHFFPAVQELHWEGTS